MVALSLSLLVSYVRAKAESLGVDLAGLGVGERAERLLILSKVSLLPIANAMQWAVMLRISESLPLLLSYSQNCCNIKKVIAVCQSYRRSNSDLTLTMPLWTAQETQ